MKTVVAILETMWGNPGDAPPYFRINPNNKSGKRLYTLAGEDNLLWVTNACRECVSSASEHGKPDPTWLHDNLWLLDGLGPIAVVLVCGKVAQKTYQKSGWDPGRSTVIEMPHPAARFLWTRELMAEIGGKIEEALR